MPNYLHFYASVSGKPMQYYRVRTPTLLSALQDIIILRELSVKFFSDLVFSKYKKKQEVERNTIKIIS